MGSVVSSRRRVVPTTLPDACSYVIQTPCRATCGATALSALLSLPRETALALLALQWLFEPSLCCTAVERLGASRTACNSLYRAYASTVSLFYLPM